MVVAVTKNYQVALFFVAILSTISLEPFGIVGSKLSSLGSIKAYIWLNITLPFPKHPDRIPAVPVPSPGFVFCRSDSG